MDDVAVLSVQQWLPGDDWSKKLCQLLQPLGGEAFFFTPGERVVILADWGFPAAAGLGINVDPRLLGGLAQVAYAQQVAEVAVALRVAPGFVFDQVLALSGYDTLLEQGVRLIDLAQAPVICRTLKSGLTGETVTLARQLVQADLLINCAKFKAAEGVLFGSAMENLAHVLPPEQASLAADMRPRALVDVAAALLPDLHIIDACKGEAGYQPQYADALLAGSDVLAIDSALAALGGLSAQQVEALRLAAQYGLGQVEPGATMVYGDDLLYIMEGRYLSEQQQEEDEEGAEDAPLA